MPDAPVFGSVNVDFAARGGDANEEQGHHELKLDNSKCIVLIILIHIHINLRLILYPFQTPGLLPISGQHPPIKASE